MASIEGGHVTDRQPLSGGDHGAIDRSQWPSSVGLDQFGDARPILGCDVFGDQVADGHVPQEPHFSVVTESSPDEVDHLRQYQYGYQQRTRRVLEQFKALGVVVVVCVDVGVDRAGIDKEGYRETSWRRISSMRTETSCEPLLPAAEAMNFRRPDLPPR